jgi:hypothetical protein
VLPSLDAVANEKEQLFFPERGTNAGKEFSDVDEHPRAKTAELRLC